jgi:hypothetical protein
VRVGAGHLALECFGRSDLGKLHLRDQVVCSDVAVLELLVEVAGEKQHGIFEFALAVAERLLTEFADREHRADRDRRDQETAAEDKP